jgi:hypothetical protein
MAALTKGRTDEVRAYVYQVYCTDYLKNTPMLRFSQWV